MADPSLADHRNTAVAEVFSTIRSPVFFELVVVLANGVRFLGWEAGLFDTLRRMNEVRPFKLVFSLEASPPSQQETQQLEKVLEFVTSRLLDFLDSPPSFRIPRSRFYDWDSLWGRLVLIVSAKGSAVLTSISPNLGVKTRQDSWCLTDLSQLKYWADSLLTLPSTTFIWLCGWWEDWVSASYRMSDFWKLVI